MAVSDAKKIDTQTDRQINRRIHSQNERQMTTIKKGMEVKMASMMLNSLDVRVFQKFRERHNTSYTE